MSSRCVGGLPDTDGHLGYELTATGGLREIAPDTCPNGHHPMPKGSTYGWDGQRRYLTCGICWPDEEHHTWHLCTCRADRIAYGGDTYVPLDIPALMDG
jgi:hypothetical protein